MGWTLQQVAAHNDVKSCWVIIHEKVYDVTNFLPEHPGGAQIILKYAGRDATAAYDPIHPRDALDKNLSKSQHLGPLDREAARQSQQQREARAKTQDEIRTDKAMKERPPLSRVLSLADMEEVARRCLSYKALAYYSSAADDEITHQENARAFSRFFFSPRVMRRVGHCDPSTRILGFKASLPIFVSGAALAKLGHPDGEVNITRGVGTDLIQMVSSNASLSPQDIISASVPGQALFFQLYKHSNDEVAAKRVRDIEALGYKAIFLTVDAIVPGNRERDIKSPWVLEDMERNAASSQTGGGDVPRDIIDVEEQEEDDGGLGTAGALIKYDDRDMTWENTIPWLRSITKMPIVLKGIQCVQDAVLAAKAGVDGILISNHGGRQLEYAMPPLEVLWRLRRQHPEVFSKLEVYIDGGVSRGTDVVKAVCLGATAVGLGRPFLYAQSAYGAAGVKKIVRILDREIVTAMRLLGASSISDLTPELVERIDWEPSPKAKL